MAKTLIDHGLYPKELWQLDLAQGSVFYFYYRQELAKGKSNRHARRAGMWHVRHE